MWAGYSVSCVIKSSPHIRHAPRYYYVLLQYENIVSYNIAVYCFPSVVEVYSNVEAEASRSPPKSF